MQQLTPFFPPLNGFLPVACAYGKMEKADVPLSNFGVVKLELPPNGETKDYDHEIAHFHRGFDEYYVVASGTGYMYLNGVKIAVATGDVTFIPSGLAHHFKAGPTGATLFVASDYDESDCQEISSFEGFAPICSTGEFVKNIAQVYQLGHAYQSPKLFCNDGIKVFGLSLPAGREVPSHLVPTDAQEMYIALKGEATLIIGDEEVLLTPLSVKALEAGVAHRLLSESDFQAIVFQINNQTYPPTQTENK